MIFSYRRLVRGKRIRFRNADSIGVLQNYVFEKEALSWQMFASSGAAGYK